MFNFLKNFGGNNTLPEVAIEYRAPHWMILIRNPGQKKWEPVRSADKKVMVQDEFGVGVKTYPAIASFPTQSAAEQWVATNVKEHYRKARTKSEFTAWVAGETDSTNKYQYTAA
jgi:hypothetical protein